MFDTLVWDFRLLDHHFSFAAFILLVNHLLDSRGGNGCGSSLTSSWHSNEYCFGREQQL